MTLPHRRARKRQQRIALCLLIGLGGVLLTVLLALATYPPRALGPYLERRAQGHHGLITLLGEHAASVLIALDRGRSVPSPLPESLLVGAQHNRVWPTQSQALTRPVLVSTTQQLAGALEQAQPGDAITLLPGTYRIGGRTLVLDRPGHEGRRIALRADQAGTVFLESEAVTALHVSAPYWTIENLHVRGLCTQHSDCEHAVHVVGNAHHFAALNNAFVDFNAHVKINGDGKAFPDQGRIEHNTLTNTQVRQTSNPVTPIDLVAASGWIIRHNLITDFIKGQGDQISYGAFAKGGGSGNRFEQNIVVCEVGLSGHAGARIGLSLGGGGTGTPYCRDRRCITEHDDGTIEANLIAHCSDDGIYLNKAARSRIHHNTLIDTGGIVVRYSESSADVDGNLVDGAVRVRDGALLRGADNVETAIAALYLGYHPVRALLSSQANTPWHWQHAPPQRQSRPRLPLDLCAATRSAAPAYGAFDDFRGCMR